ncbi:motility associated factor glycosyltransferase family protein [Psychrobacillus psychrotolerans]|uniref:motility associated factor glycosyltransferase family protein n=1 Tax=Psychrobacillus psychrotolerans TaxID=126156 RepID=UPI003315926B
MYSPEKEVERFLKKMSTLKNNFVVFLGYGNGELLEQLVNSNIYKQNIHFLFIEPFSEVVRSDAHIKTFSKLKDKLSFLYYKELKSFAFTAFLAEFIGIPTSIHIHPNYIKVDEPLIKSCLQVIDEGIRVQQVTNSTEAKYAVDWIVEPLLNIENTSNAIKINALKGKFKGERAILVAAGPSLKDHIPFLQENKNGFHLFSVGSALRALLEYDIEPDYVLSMDTSLINYETHFKDLDYRGTLIFETISNSFIQNNHKGPLIVSKTKSDHVSSHYIENLNGFTQASPSVAVFTLQVLAYLGFSEVYLVGQDLALVNGEYYAKGVRHHEAVKSVREELRVENNQGNLVGTTRALKIFLDTFEVIIKHISDDVKIYNLSEQGAKIKGTTFIDESKITKGTKNAIAINEWSQQGILNLRIITQDFIGKLKSLQKQISEARKNLNRLLQIGVVSAKDMSKVVKDFSRIRENTMLEEVLLANLTFMFKMINNKFKMFDLKKRYMSQDYLELITELEKFYALISKLCSEVVTDERLKNYK